MVDAWMLLIGSWRCYVVREFTWMTKLVCWYRVKKFMVCGREGRCNGLAMSWICMVVTLV